MIRFLLLSLLFFFVWRILRILFRGAQRRSDNGRRPYGAVHNPPEQRQNQSEKYPDVTDARFEEVPPDKKKD
jgi:hypothetical protein